MGIEPRSRKLFVLGSALAAAAMLSGCPKRVVVVDGVEMAYEDAAKLSFERAQEHQRAGRDEEAIESYRTFLGSYSDSDRADEAYFQLGRLHHERGEDALAKKHYLLLLESHPFSDQASRARLYLGLLHVEAGEYNDAIQVLRPAYKKLDGDEKRLAARGLSDASVGLEDWPAAVRWVAEVRDLARDLDAQKRADAMLVDLIDARLPAIALARLREDLDPDSPAFPLVLIKLAKIHYHLQEYALAHAGVTEYLRRWPTGPYAEGATALRERLDRLARINPLVVGVLLPLSGKYQSFGEAVLRGVGMALDLEPGTATKSRVVLVIRDTKGEPAEAIAQLEKLVLEEGAIAVIGPLLQNVALAAARKGEELAVPMISLSRAEGLTEQGPWTFRNAVTDTAQAEALVAYAADRLGAKSLGILYPNHAYGEGMMERFWTAAEARQLEIRAAERYDHDETTFKSPIKRMVGRYYLSYRYDYQQEKRRVMEEVTDDYRRRKALEKVRDEVEPIADFDVLFIPDSYKTVGLIAPALAVEDVITNVCDTRDLERIKKTTGKDELPTVRLLGGNAWNSPQLVERGGKYVRCSVFVDGFFAESTRKETKAFVDAYQNAYGKETPPGYLEAHGFDTASIVREIIEKRAPKRRSDFRTALLQLRDFPGSTGATTFRPDGEVVKPLFLLTVDRNRIVEVEEEGGAGGTP